MAPVKIKFLETKIVQDGHEGTDLETKYDLGSIVSFEDARSAVRWVRRGVAKFASEEDAKNARESVGDIVDQRIPPREADEGEAEEEAALATRLVGKVIAAQMKISHDDWLQLSPEQRREAILKSEAEFDEGYAAELARRKAAEDGQGGGPKPVESETPDFDTMSDDDLRAFIEERDGKKPHPNAKHETLVAKAKGEVAGDEDDDQA